MKGGDRELREFKELKELKDLREFRELRDFNEIRWERSRTGSFSEFQRRRRA